MYRIVSFEQGYMVQREERKWYGKKYWKCWLTYRGTEEPFYFSTFERALESLMREIKWKVTELSR